jgi:hypothetical protein
MSKQSDIFSNKKNKSSKNKGSIPPGFFEMLKKSGEIHTPKSQEKETESKKGLERSREIKQSHFQRVKRLEKEVYSRQKKETEREIEMLRQALAQEVKKLKTQGNKLRQEVQQALQNPIINPGKSDISFLENIIRFVRGLTQEAENATLWLQAWSNKRQKRGAFWSNFSSKKGGAQYLLSGEHSPARSAG